MDLYMPYLTTLAYPWPSPCYWYCDSRLYFNRIGIAGPSPVNNVYNQNKFVVPGGYPVPAICGVNQGNRTDECYLRYYPGVPWQLRWFSYDPTYGMQLNNQDIGISARVKRNFCGIQYTSGTENADQQLNSGVSEQISSFNNDPPSGFQRTNRKYGRRIKTERKFRGLQYTSDTENANGGNAHNTGVSGQLESFNNDPPLDLQHNNQNYGRRVKKERNFRGIQYTPCSEYGIVNPFGLWYHMDNEESPSDLSNCGFCLNYVEEQYTQDY